jgi:HNH endonuclease/Homing endonuclease associated repeat
MQFKLNEYRQGVKEEDLVNDVKRISEIVGDQYLSLSVYKSNGGKFSETTFRSRLGSWTSVLSKLGLRTERTVTEMKRISVKVIILDLQRVALDLNSNVVTSAQYEELGKYSYPTIQERFGNWRNFVLKANLDPTDHVSFIPDKDLFAEIERIWIALGKQPTTTEMKKGISKYSLDTFSRRFGGWRNALQAFLEYVHSSDVENTQALVSIEDSIPKLVVSEAKQNFKLSPKKTPRNVNVKLRFTVFQTDSFRCRSCGASPAKTPEIELHVDHIIPWSKGGETEIQNLQTLCSKCNFGKSNSMIGLQPNDVACVGED